MLDAGCSLPQRLRLLAADMIDRAALCQAEGRSLLGQEPTGDQDRQGEGMLRLVATTAVLEYEVEDGWHW